ncbi:hypothetical protein AX16_006754 [Volvariella volvacea WC 439]|nr:hypothetical protein AX16_006754 [Volvariella volvacea WC 439]
MPFPAFAEYQETFNSPLPPTIFASYEVPSWVPQPAQLVRIAKAVYPHWKERRIERGGQRIIPALNFDETDTLNESYICFRRREIKAVRKTRASQATFSDKLGRLQAELSRPLELAQMILNRESMKKELMQQAQTIWEKRLAFVDLKRKYPSLGDKGDEELLVDKERPAKKSEISRIKLRPEPTNLPRPEITLKPKERIAAINKQVEATLQRQKEIDHHLWEDCIDNVYQPQPVPYASRLFKFITPPNTPRSLDSDSDGSDTPLPRPIRLRIGRGGRRILDRRHSRPRTIGGPPHRSALLAALAKERGEVELGGNDEDDEERERLASRWRFDTDDIPPHGPLGSDEQDRVLVDDYQPTYLRHHMTIFSDTDQQALVTDPQILVTLPDGRQQIHLPFRLGMPPPTKKYPPHVLQAMQQAQQAQSQQQQQQQAQQLSQPQPVGVPVSLPLAATNGTPISVQQQIKKMPPPIAMPQMRISSGTMRPPSLPVANGLPQSSTPTGHTSPPQPTPVPQHSPNSGNGIGRAAIAMPHVDTMKMDTAPLTSIPNGVVSIQSPQLTETPQAPHLPQPPEPNGTSTASPTRPKSQPQQPQPASPVTHQPQPQPHHALATNGYHLINGFNNVANVGNTTPYSQHQNSTTGLSLQQMQTLKTTFANLPPTQDLVALQANRNLSAQLMHVANGNPNYNLQLGAGANMNVKLAARPMQWSVGSPHQRPQSAMNGMEGVAVNGSMSPSPNQGHAVPVRVPSANGQRPTMRSTSGQYLNANGQLPQHSMSPRLQHSPSPLPSIAQSQSPPRLSMTPNMNIASPSLQHQQPVGASQSGY